MADVSSLCRFCFSLLALSKNLHYQGPCHDRRRLRITDHCADGCLRIVGVQGNTDDKADGRAGPDLSRTIPHSIVFTAISSRIDGALTLFQCTSQYASTASGMEMLSEGLVRGLSSTSRTNVASLRPPLPPDVVWRLVFELRHCISISAPLRNEPPDNFWRQRPTSTR